MLLRLTRERFVKFGIALFALAPVVAFVGQVQADDLPTPVNLTTQHSRQANTTEAAARLSERSAAAENKTSKAYQLNEEGVELVFKGDREGGMKKISAALESDPSNTTALYNLAGLELANSNPARAIVLMERAVELAPNDLAFWNRLAEAHFANQGIEKSIAYYEKIIALDPSYGEVMVRLGTLYGMTKNWEKAEATLRRAVELHPKDARALGNLGNILVLREKFPEAIKTLSAAQAIEDSPEYSVGLAIAHEALGKRAEALKYYEKAKALGDKDPSLDQHIAELQTGLKSASADKQPSNKP